MYPKSIFPLSILICQTPTRWFRENEHLLYWKPLPLPKPVFHNRSSFFIFICECFPCFQKFRLHLVGFLRIIHISCLSTIRHSSRISLISGVIPLKFVFNKLPVIWSSWKSEAKKHFSVRIKIISLHQHHDTVDNHHRKSDRKHNNQSLFPIS